MRHLKSGHWVMEEKPEVTAKRVIGFVAQ